MYIALFALIPIVGGALSAFIKFKSAKARNVFIEAVTMLTSACVIALAIMGDADVFRLFKLNDSFVCAFGMDGLTKVFAILIAALWPFANLYAFEYMEHEERTGNFFVFYTMAYGIALLIAAAKNLFTMYIFYECLTVVTLPLVEHEQNKEGYRAGRTYLVYLIGGASLGFAAMVIAHMSNGGEALFRFGGIEMSGGNDLSRVAFLLAFIGFGVKAAVFPLCRWLPKASAAPTPVTALLHAVAVVNAGVFASFRASAYVFPLEAIKGSYAQKAVMLLSALTVLYGAVRALRESHLKRRLAWSTVSNLGYMLFAISLLTQAGFTAAISHMLFHSFMKIVLFFCVGAIMIQTGKTDVHETRGLAKQMPFTFAAFTFAGAALSGVPPLCGFTGKYLIITAAFENAGAFETIGAISLIVSAILTACYVFTVVVPAYYAPNIEDSENLDPKWRIKAAVIFALVGIAMLSVFSNDVVNLIEDLLVTV